MGEILDHSDRNPQPEAPDAPDAAGELNEAKAAPTDGEAETPHFDQLTEENTECPKCKGFNYNLKIETPFNEEFCGHLEYKLDFNHFNKLGNNDVKGFWCDGIDHLPNDIRSLSKKNLERNKEIITKAWIGKDGQDEYEMTIKFGNESFEKYRQNQDLIDCIPTEDFQDWIRIVPERRKIEIWLK